MVNISQPDFLQKIAIRDVMAESNTSSVLVRTSSHFTCMQIIVSVQCGKMFSTLFIHTCFSKEILINLFYFSHMLIVCSQSSGMHIILLNILCEKSLQYSLFLSKYLPWFFIIDAVKAKLDNILFDKISHFKI